MKIKMKYIVAQACLVAGASIALTSCNDFLDREPLDQVTPQEYFQTADHLAAYTISKYNSMFSTHSVHWPHRAYRYHIKGLRGYRLL